MTDVKLPETTSDGATARWAGASIPEVFREAAARHAGRIALDVGKEKFTYAELDALTDRLAGAFRPLADDRRPIAVLADVAPSAVSAILGILKAGHAYLPLNPMDAPARIEFMLQDSDARAIVADSRNHALAVSLSGGRLTVVQVDDAARVAPSPGQAPHVSPEAMAALIYTSGSTGHPKGVMQTHRNYLYYVARYSEMIGLVPADRLSLLFTLSFSASTIDIFGALINGAALCPQDLRREGAAGLHRWIEDRGITVLHTVSSLYRRMLSLRNGNARFEGVRAVDLGGEPVFAADVGLHRAHFRPDCLLINHLGATEFGVIAQHLIDPSREYPSGAIPAGMPPPGTEVRILNEDGSEALPEQAGEVMIHSPYISPGYWKRPDLTSEAFSEDPQRTGWRVYHTGDLGRKNAAGLLFHLGRRDDRVKIRGHSVHLLEVEAAIRALSGVQDAVVVAVSEEREGAGERRLIAYLVGEDVDAPALRRSLFERLPSYMWPAEFNVMPSLPQTATGKVDRRALSGPDRPKPQRTRNLTPPQDDDERTIAATFSKILQLSPVGRSESFFDLGGDSLSLAPLQLEVNRVLGIEIPLQEMLKDATVSGLAESVRRWRAARPAVQKKSDLLVSLRETGSEPPLFLVHGIYGSAHVSPWFLAAVGEGRPVYSFQAKGVDGRARPHCSIAEMADAYLREMRKIQPRGPYFVGGICAGGIVAHEMVHRLRDSGQPTAPLLLIDPPLPVREENWRRRAYKFLVLCMIRLPLRPAFISNIVGRQMRRNEEWAGRGRTLFDPDDSIMRMGAMRFIIQFRFALFAHRPRILRCPAFVLASRWRSRKYWRRSGWRKYLPGEVMLFEVAERHGGTLDPGNTDFAAGMRDYFEAGRQPS